MEKNTLDSWIGKYLDKVWREEWAKIEGHRQTKFWLSGPDPNLSNILIKMSRKRLGRCLQWFTGHGWWKRHLNIAKLDDMPIHIFTECEAVKWDRMNIFGSFYDPPVNAEWERVLDFVFLDEIQDLIAFTEQNSKVIPKDSTQ